MTFEITQGDTDPPLHAILSDANGQPYQVQPGDVVTFRMRSVVPGLRADISAPASINDAPAGDVQYDWDPSDTTDFGVFDAEFHVANAGAGSSKTFPNGEFIRVVIKPAAISE